MTENLYADIGYQSLCKHGQIVCGDHVERIDRPDGSIVLVLADGLGSGVKACILATLTSTIISRMIAEDLPITYCVSAIAEALPICSVRKLAYSTFTVVHIMPTGMAYLVQYDNPGAILFRDGAQLPIPFVKMEIGDKLIESAMIQLKKGDVLMTYSDGAEHSGVGPGMSYSLGWGQRNIAEYMAPLCCAGFSAKTLNTIFLDECSRRYDGKPGDDTTALTVYMRSREQVNLMIGPRPIWKTMKRCFLCFSASAASTSSVAAPHHASPRNIWGNRCVSLWIIRTTTSLPSVISKGWIW